MNSLNRDDFLQRVQDRLGGEAEAVARLRRQLAIASDKDNATYTVTARDSDPRRAQALANAVVEELRDFVSQLGEQGMDHGLQALEGQRREAEQALAAAQSCRR